MTLVDRYPGLVEVALIEPCHQEGDVTAERHLLGAHQRRKLTDNPVAREKGSLSNCFLLIGGN